ncbi:MAG: Gfo/Idh/MocA family oxidoreductase [Armatimonadetes bacterium]|nr:Gfo/Idh/MocA family oxidoreductase [Armatimonadota bacterium]PIU64556.1 MAG: hypothetical protein COS85_12065 [Armatimonadetes bacterium CG07_land_8_20_14_0_80_59_28]
MKQQRIGIIGMRGMGDIRAKVAAKRDDCQVACIAGRDEAFLQSKADEFGCPYVLDSQELINSPEVDAVVVATPNHLHYPFGLQAIEAGKHVFLEYPPAISLEELDLLIEARDAKGVTLGVGLSGRFEGPHLFLKRNLSKIGRPVLAHGSVALEYIWKWSKCNDIMGDFFALANFHHIDQSIDLFGAVEWVNATLTEEQDSEGNNVLLAGATQMGFAGGVVGWSQYLMGVPARQIWVTTISGSAGSLVSESGKITWSHRDANGCVTHEDIEPQLLEEKPAAMEADFGSFVEATKNGKPCTLSCELARHSCEVAFASTRSARIGQRVSVSAPLVEVQLHTELL